MRRTLLATRLQRAGVTVLAASAVVTVAVRALGLASQGVLSSQFGASRELDAFFIALVVPGFVVTPIAAAVETAAAPRLAALRESMTAKERSVARRLLLGSGVTGLVLAVTAILAASPLVFLSAPAAGAERHELARTAAAFIYLAIFPQIITVVATTVLLARGRFVAPVTAGAVNPATVIIALLLFPQGGLRTLALAVLIGYVLEAAILLGVVISGGLSSTTTLASSAEVREIGRTMRPLLLTYFVVRGVALTDQMFASTLEPGGIARFGIALKLFEVGFAILIIPNARMAVNRMVKSASRSSDTMRDGSREVIASIVLGGVSAVCLAVGAPIVLLTVYGHGEFSTDDIWATAHIAWVFAAALVAAGPYFLLPRLLVMVGDLRAVLVLSGLELVLNAALNAVFTPAFGAVGIAGSTAVSYLIVTGVAFSRYRRRGRTRPAGPSVPVD